MTDITVTATQGGASFAGMSLLVRVLTGAKPVAQQTGATAHAENPALDQVSITTTAAGSFVYAGVSQGSGTEPMVPVTGCTVQFETDDATHTETYGAVRTTSATGTPGATTVGISSSNSAFTDIAALEILPATSITEDASSPTGVGTTTATTIATASFNPPAGSLLVAMIGSDGAGNGLSLTTMSVSDSSGLTWTEVISSASTGTCYAGVWIAQVPVVGPATQLLPYTGGQVYRRRKRVLRQHALTTPPQQTAQPIFAISPLAGSRRKPSSPPGNRIIPGVMAPPVIAPVLRARPSPARKATKQYVIIGMPTGHGLSGIPVQQASHRRPKLVTPQKRYITAPLAPGVVPAVTPIRPTTILQARRGPPPRLPNRIITGAARPVMYWPVRQTRDLSRLRRQPGMRIGRGDPGSLTRPVPVPVTFRNRQKIRAPALRIIPGIVIPPFTFPAQPEPSVLAHTAYRLRKAPRQSVITGMLRGTGLSGIPETAIRSYPTRIQRQPRQGIKRGERGSLTVPAPVPVTIRQGQRLQRRQRGSITLPPFVPAGIVYQPVSAPTHIISTFYRLKRQPRMSLVTGMLPGRGLSGIPESPARQTVPRLRVQPRQIVRRGERGSLTVPAPNPVTLRSRQKIRTPPQKLTPGVVIPASTAPSQPYPVVLAHTAYRLRTSPRQTVRTGMLPGRGLSGIPVRQVRAAPPRKLSKQPPQGVRAGQLPGPVTYPALIYPAVFTRCVQPPRKVQKQPRQQTRTGWLAWGIIPSLPGNVTVTNNNAGAVTAGNQQAGVVTVENQHQGGVIVVNTE